jgi:hypothetical protein
MSFYPLFEHVGSTIYLFIYTYRSDSGTGFIWNVLLSRRRAFKKATPSKGENKKRRKNEIKNKQARQYKVFV